MATTYTAVPANVTLTAAPTETLPSDGDALAVGGINPTLQKLLDFIANISNLILNGFAATLRLANQATAMPPVGLTTALTPITGWTASSGLAYWKDAGGSVHMKGGVTYSTGAATAAIVTLPGGFRPAANRSFACATPAGTSLVMAVVSDGTVNLVSAAPATGTFIDLDVVSFLAEQ